MRLLAGLTQSGPRRGNVGVGTARLVPCLCSDRPHARSVCEHVFVRWSNLEIDHGEEEEARLPGYRDPAVVRRFDAPEVLDVRFYEIRAKSALNKVPKASKMPFRWTINPYRGCTHACLYCVGGETPVLMADGRHKPIRTLRVGDEIYGTERRGRYRRYVRTRVLAHWAAVKPAYRIVLDDGTELIASGDHRFLTRRGWKHVTGSQQGRDRRPHLTLGNSLLGSGRFETGPRHSDDYERAYLCGIVRGDGTLGSYSYDRPGRTSPALVHRFRLALADGEALARAERYLFACGVYTKSSRLKWCSARRCCRSGCCCCSKPEGF